MILRLHRRRRHFVVRATAAIVAVGVVASCGGDDPSSEATQPPGATDVATSDTSASTASSPATETSPAVAVPTALDFSAPLVGGGDIEMGEYAGRPVLLWFWAPW